MFCYINHAVIKIHCSSIWWYDTNHIYGKDISIRPKLFYE